MHVQINAVEQHQLLQNIQLVTQSLSMCEKMVIEIAVNDPSTSTDVVGGCKE